MFTLTQPTPRPVLIIIFNRKETVRQLLEVLEKVRPPRLYLASDGARPDRPGEAEMVESVREFALGRINWDCEVRTLFREENRGCREGITESIDWFFEHEEAGIIFEDDCLPGPDFFPYCDELLARYANEEKVMHIGGSCLTDLGPTDSSYYFSRYPLVWGWATWRRAWRKDSLSRPADRDFERVMSDFATPGESRYWRRIMDRFYAGEIETWDYPWQMSIWLAGGVAISPTVNLVSNIGFGRGSANMKNWKDFRGLGNRAPAPLGEIVHPGPIAISDEPDGKMFRDAYHRPASPVLALRVMRHLLTRRQVAPNRT